MNALAQDRRHRVDVGRVCGGDYPEGRYFINGVGIGFDAVRFKAGVSRLLQKETGATADVKHIP